MAEWSRNKVDSDQLNNGQEYTTNSNVSREQLNSMINAGLYAQDFAEKLVENIDTSEADNVGTPTVTVVDGTGATTDKPYKKFKFANLKGEQGSQGVQGEKGEKGETGSPAGFGTPTATIDDNVGTPSVIVTATGDDTAKVFNFDFRNLKGEQGIRGEKGEKGEPGGMQDLSNYYTKNETINYVNNAIASAITTTLNTGV